ncbi:MAG: serine/threonine-protein kinase, partial [Gammaproteobacteria bacterium]
RGDYQLDFKASRVGGEIGQVSQAFDSLLSDLREKSEIETYMADLAKYQSDNAAEQALLAAAVTSSLPKSVSGSTTPDLAVTQAGNLTLDPRLQLAPGTVLVERYDILSELGSGGMAKVYKARDRQLDEVVALKMLKVDASKDGAALEAIKNEIRLARKITHRNVLRTYDYGDANGMPFISMEYVAGVTLHYLLQNRSRLPYAAGLRIMRQVCAGLQVAHSEGVLHLDIKPGNVMLEPTGNAKLMDFGIAGSINQTDNRTAGTGLMATPRYAAPEQLQGKPVDARTDVYACGVMMYEMFTGKSPFNKREFDELLAHKLKENYRSPESLDKDFPPAIAALIAACLKANPEARPTSARKLLSVLEKLRS